MTTRTIEPKRDTSSGDLYHFCPKVEDNIGQDDCTGCPFLNRMEQLQSRYRVHCDFALEGDVDLTEYQPPKATDTYRGLRGLRVLHSPSHPWIEPKLDGARAIVHCTADGVFITSRRRNKQGRYTQFQDNVPHLRDHPALIAIGQSGYTILDGEVIAPVDTDSLAATMSVVGAGPEHALAAQEVSGKLVLHLFDVHTFKGTNVTTTQLSKRRPMLEDFASEFLDDGDAHIKLVEYEVMAIIEEREQVTTSYIASGLEGSIAKNPNAMYFQSQAWLKAKQRVTVDALVTGWEPGSKGGKYEHTLGALKVSVLDLAEGSLREIANVVPGDDKLRDELRSKLSSLTVEQIAELGMVVEMEAQGYTKDYRLRHPRIVRYREDRSEPNTVDFAAVQTL